MAAWQQGGGALPCWQTGQHKARKRGGRKLELPHRRAQTLLLCLRPSALTAAGPTPQASKRIPSSKQPPLTPTSCRNCLSSGGSSLGWRRVKRGISRPFRVSRNWVQKGSWGQSRVDALGSTPLQFGESRG